MPSDDMPEGNEHPVQDDGAANASAVAAGKETRLGPFSDLVEANLVKASIEDHGIDVQIDGENTAAVLGPMYGRAYTGGVYLRVRAGDAPPARHIIADIEQKRRARMSREIPPCPKCQAPDARRIVPPIRWVGVLMLLGVVVAFGVDHEYALLAAGVLLIAGLYLIVREQVPLWKCRACAFIYHAAIPELPDD